ncbi:MAG: alpha/beta fold hydrolase [Pseudomonadota bacterium]
MNFTFNGMSASEDTPSLVLIHGAGGSHLDWPIPWRNITAAPAEGHSQDTGQGGHVLQGFPVYAIDLPGHGDSGGDSLDTIDAYAQRVVTFLEENDIKNACLAGHSMGAAVAANTCLLDPSRVGSLCLVGGGAKIGVSQDLLDGLAKATEATVAAISRACWHKSTLPMFREVVRRRMLASGTQTLINDFTACSTVDLRSRLSEIAVPTLLVAAQEDRMVPMKDIEAMATSLQKPTVKTLEGCGHFLHFEKSDDIAKLLAEFLSA